MFNGTVYNVGDNYYEVVKQTKNKIKVRWVNSYITKTKTYNPLSKIPVRVKKPGFKFRQWELVDFPTESNAYSTHGSNKVTNLKQFNISEEILATKKVELRLTINNIVARIFLGKNKAKTMLNNLVIKRLGNGTAKSEQGQAGDSQRGN